MIYIEFNIIKNYYYLKKKIQKKKKKNYEEKLGRIVPTKRPY